MRFVCFIIILLLIPSQLLAQQAMIKDGNVYFKRSEDNVIQLTTSGRDSNPQLSPDGKLIAVVRDTPGILVGAGAGDENATELWLINVNTRQSSLLAKGNENPDPKKALASFSSPCFSPDSRTIYFMSAAWATSGSIQKISLNTKKVQFVTDGVAYNVIPNGNYRGFLLVNRALIKYDKAGNSLGRDVYLWLVSANGKLIKEIGQADGKAASNFIKKHLR